MSTDCGSTLELTNMGHAARRNETAQSASRGELYSRQSIIGAMDHALELHAAALRLLEAKIVALKERIEKLEIMLHIGPTPVEYTEADAAFQRVADTVESQMNSIVAKQHAKEEYANAD